METDELSRLRARIAEHPEGEFHLPQVWGAGWDALPIGEKVRAGREFLAAVRAGRVPGVEDTGARRGGGRVYRRTAEPGLPKEKGRVRTRPFPKLFR